MISLLSFEIWVGSAYPSLKYKKAVLSQRRPRDAPYIAALKILESPWLRLRPLVSKIFNGLLLRVSLRMFRPNLKFIALSVP